MVKPAVRADLASRGQQRPRLGLPIFTIHPLLGPGGSEDKASVYNVGDLDSIPGSGRFPGEGKGYPLRYSGLENSMDSIVHGKESDPTEQLTLLEGIT